MEIKYLLIALTALFIMEYAPAANAVVCARGVYRAGCAGQQEPRSLDVRWREPRSLDDRWEVLWSLDARWWFVRFPVVAPSGRAKPPEPIGPHAAGEGAILAGRALSLNRDATHNANATHDGLA
jgi:hypothetical protein